MIQQLRLEIQTKLQAYYDEKEANAIAKRLIEHLFSAPYPLLLLNLPKGTNFEKTLRERLDSWISRLLAHEPLQYILGECLWDDMKLEVSPAVLIPRPETEYLCTLIRQRGLLRNATRIADLCTGSGCIALSLARHAPKALVDAIDWSEEALQIAKKNCRQLSLQDRVRFLKKNILVPSQVEESESELYDLIVSNPPYVLETEKTEIAPHVLSFEPHMALFVPDNAPLIFYEKILEQYTKRLRNGGTIAFETNKEYAHQIASLCAQNGLNSTVEKDQYDRDRFVLAQKPL